MNSETLQKTINENLRATGKEGRFKIIVAKEGIVWTAEKSQKEKSEFQQPGQLPPIGNVLGN
jgi:hypothetical protein